MSSHKLKSLFALQAGPPGDHDPTKDEICESIQPSNDLTYLQGTLQKWDYHCNL